MIRRILTVGLFLAGACLLAGCIDSETRVVIKADGGGTVTETVYVARQMERLLTIMASSVTDTSDGGSPAWKRGLNRALFRQRAQRMGEGVKLTGFKEVQNRTGGKGYEAVYEFADINTLTLSTEPLCPSPTFREASAAATNAFAPGRLVTFAFSRDGDPSLKINLPWPDEMRRQAVALRETMQGDGARLSREDLALLRHVFGGFRARMVVTTMTDIEQTNAAYVERGFGPSRHTEVLLYDLNLGEVVHNEPAAARLAAIGAASDVHEALAKYFQLPGVRVEARNPVTMSLRPKPGR